MFFHGFSCKCLASYWFNLKIANCHKKLNQLKFERKHSKIEYQSQLGIETEILFYCAFSQILINFYHKSEFCSRTAEQQNLI